MEDRLARQKLFDEHRAWAVRLAGFRCRSLARCVTLAEVESAALEGLWDAVGRWDGQRPFRPYASWRIHGAIGDYLRSLYPRGAGRSEGRKVRMEQLPIVCDQEDPQAPLAVATVDEEDEIAVLLRPLPARQRQVFQRWLHGERLGHIARSLGVCESRVSKIVAEGLSELRRVWRKG